MPESSIGELSACPICKRPMRIVASGDPGPTATSKLTIVDGPMRAREQFFLAGNQPIEIGKLPDKLISLTGTMVSRNHCRLLPGASGWTVEDLKSTNGVFVNSKRIASAALRDGDIVKIGEYELRYESHTVPSTPALNVEPEEVYEEASVATPPVAPTALPRKKSSAVAQPTADFPADDFGSYDVAPDADIVDLSVPAIPAAAVSKAPASYSQKQSFTKGTGPVCPCCGLTLAPTAQLCVTCGIKIPSGRPITTAREVDSEELYDRSLPWVQAISLFIPINLIPIASEAFGTKKARSVWYIVGITFLCSALFLVSNWGDMNPPKNYSGMMLWCGSNAARKEQFELARKSIEKLNPTKSKSAIKKTPKKPVSDDADPNLTADDLQLTPQEYKELVAEFDAEAKATESNDFQLYQLLTNAFLHGGIMHFVGNMVFLLVFGLRVNEALGDLKFSIVYPVLAILASLIYFISASGQPMHPALGASGAIMGLAGMYFVFFPVQHVHMAFWLRIHWRLGVWLKIFRMRGFWLLVLWVGFNDVLPVAMHKYNHGIEQSDGVAHWAHLGGFISGMVIAIALLISRLATARGSDLISFTLGKAAWPLLGKPHTNLEAPIASAPRKRIKAAFPR